MVVAMVLLVLFPPCLGMTMVLLVYICLLYMSVWNTENQVNEGSRETVQGKGLSPGDLEKLPKVAGKELVLGTDCAVCLDEIEGNQAAKMVPGCNHGFHLECADAWLSKNPVCPVCRGEIEAELLSSSETNTC